MFRRFCFALRLATLTGAGLVASTFAQVNIPASSVAGPVPASPGTGLPATVYNVSGNSFGEALIDSTTTDPAGTFLATLIDYPNGSDAIISQPTPFADFLGVDGASLTGTPNPSFSIGIVFKGFIAIAEPGEVFFNVASDDGFRLSIGGVLVTQFADERAFGDTGETVIFDQEGLYPIELFFWANGFSESGLEFSSSIPGGPSVGQPSPAVGVVPTAVLYAVPEVHTFPLVAGALAILSLITWRSKRSNHLPNEA